MDGQSATAPSPQMEWQWARPLAWLLQPEISHPEIAAPMLVDDAAGRGGEAKAGEAGAEADLAANLEARVHERVMRARSRNSSRRGSPDAAAQPLATGESLRDAKGGPLPPDDDQTGPIAESDEWFGAGGGAPPVQLAC